MISLFKIFKFSILVFLEILILPLLFVLAFLARFTNRRIKIGLGPEPLINNTHHVKALRLYGWSAESFVDSVYFITNDFDVKIISNIKFNSYIIRILFIPFIFSIFRYNCLYIYFNGGGLYSARLIWLFEPLLYKLANVKIVVMPYGGDVQDLMKSNNLYFRHCVGVDYPRHFRRRLIINTKVFLWSLCADHVIAGCDWVEYIQHWDTLCIAHFSIDTSKWSAPLDKVRRSGPIRILHAPNHREIKGSKFFERAISNLKNRGLDVELIIVQGIPNDKLKDLIDDCDIIADQLIIGWYAMFAIEGMASAKPVLCYIRRDLEDLFVNADLLDRGELPIVKCDPENIEIIIEKLICNPQLLTDYGKRGVSYVKRRHSIEAIGELFNSINLKISL